MIRHEGEVIAVNGPIIKAKGLRGTGMLDIAEVGPLRLIGEVIRIQDETVYIQVYEDNSGLKVGDPVCSSGRPLSVLLGPGLISNIYDGIQRPLIDIAAISGDFIEKGIKVNPLNAAKKWTFTPQATEGGEACPGQIIGEVRETSAIIHKILVPPDYSGRITYIAPAGEYTIEETVYSLACATGQYDGRLASYWPVRKQRPFAEKRRSSTPLITGQRIIDTFFSVAKGGTAAIPGGFGTGKTMTQQQLARWADSDIIVYIGCGERGNEMTEVLNEFPLLTDPRTGTPIMERTIMIANTSNMPVPAREVSIYTGVTLAEYYRDMGYHVAVLADSTSRWAEALRELSSRLGDMPAEEGFPSYLATGLAEFYERAGYVKTLSGQTGSITIIGAVSPPGGDFSEPVTQHTTRYTRCLWALDKNLADARHYPSISWTDSYSEYIGDITNWWTEVDIDWPKRREEAMAILQEEVALQQIVKIMGTEALPPEKKFLLYCAEILKNGFLQQNSFDPKDMYCSPEKQVELLSLLVTFYNELKPYILNNDVLEKIQSLKSVHRLNRLKSDVANEQLDDFHLFKHQLENDLMYIKQGS